MYFRCLIGRFFRWMRRTFQYFCTIDHDYTAKQFAGTLGSYLQEEREQDRMFKLLRGVAEEDHEAALEHLSQLSDETDPLENVSGIPDDAVIVTKTNVFDKPG